MSSASPRPDRAGRAGPCRRRSRCRRRRSAAVIACPSWNVTVVSARLPDADDHVRHGAARRTRRLRGLEVGVEGHRVGDHRRADVGHRHLCRLGPPARVARCTRTPGAAGRARACSGRSPSGRPTSGPMPFLTPLTSCSSASVAPRHGVPSVMSLRVDLGAAALLDVPARDEATHGVADEDDLGVGIRPALRPQPLQRRLDDGPQALAVVAVRQAPVVGERDERGGPAASVAAAGSPAPRARSTRTS